MIYKKNDFSKIPYARLHDSLFCIAKWDATKCVHSIYIDPHGVAAIIFDGILDDDTIRLVLSELNWGEESYKDIDTAFGFTHSFDYSSNSTYVFTPKGFDIRS